jgi:hypothetical protein
MAQPARSTCSIPVKYSRLSCDERAFRPRAGGSSEPMIAHSSPETLPRPKANYKKAALN